MLDFHPFNLESKIKSQELVLDFVLRHCKANLITNKEDQKVSNDKASHRPKTSRYQ
jgi:hypothetical protein